MKEKVIRILTGLREMDAESVTEGLRLKEDLGMDSLDKAEFISEIEDDLNIKIPDTDFQKLLTIGEIFSYVEAQTTLREVPEVE